MTDAELYEMDDLERQLGALARSITDNDRELSAPPPDLFAAIRTELAGGTDLAGDDLTGPASTPAHSVPPPDHQSRGRSEVVATTDSTAHVRSGASPVVDLDAERNRRRGLTVWGVLSAAAALAVLAVSGLYLAGLAQDDPRAGTTLASATIANDGLPIVFDRTAEASLVDVNGDLQLDVAFDRDGGALPADVDGFYEVWLIDENVEGMISLGVLTADGRLDVPDTVNPEAFPVVDISVEPLDGDPTHSGQSVLRGVLSF